MVSISVLHQCLKNICVAYLFQALLEGANLMDVRDVGDACYDYMQRHIDTDNCGINKGIYLTINAQNIFLVDCL